MGRRLVALLALVACLLAIAPVRSATPYVAVIVWHDVIPGDHEVWFDTSLDTFRTQLDTIARGGYHVITLAALRDALEHGTPLPPKAIALTFDDNGHGLYENAFPLLQAHHFPATFFVHTNFVGKTTSKRHNTWPQLQAMSHSGLVSVQSLTANHPPDLRALDDAAVVHELRLSKSSLEARLGKPVFAFVYPEDNYDDRLARLVARNGYALAFTEDWGNAMDSPDHWRIHRYSALTRFAQALADAR